MRLTITIPDDMHEELEKVASAQGLKKPAELLEKHLEAFKNLALGRPQILLDSTHIAKISNVLGGQPIRSANDIVNILTNSLTITVEGAEVTIAPEDAIQLQQQYGSTGYKDYKKYLADSVNEALSVYLYGSGRGVLTW